jgi:hypothetical protein
MKNKILKSIIFFLLLSFFLLKTSSKSAFADTIFSDNFDPIISSQWTIGSGWQLSNTFYSSPTTSFFGPNATTTYSSSLRTSTPIVIPPNAVLSFKHRYNFETRCDGGRLEISTNNGTTWQDLGGNSTTFNDNSVTVLKTGYDMALTCSSSPIFGQFAWTGDMSGNLKLVTVSLSAFSGQSAIFRFLDTADNGDAATSGGWYIDDFLIQTAGSSTPTPTPTAGPSSTPTSTPTVGPTSTPTLTPTATPTLTPGNLISGLLDYWKMDETNGNILGIYAGKTFTVSGAVSNATGKVYTTSRLFPGVGTLGVGLRNDLDVRFGDNDVTFALWWNQYTIPIGSGNNMYHYLWQQDDYSGGYTIGLNRADQLFVQSGSGSNQFDTLHSESVLQPTNTWHFAIVWYDRNEIANTRTLNAKVYTRINGVDTITTSSTPVSAHTSGGFPARIGSSYTNDNVMEGLIGPIAVWNKILTVEEMAELWNSGNGLTYEQMISGLPTQQPTLTPTITPTLTSTPTPTNSPTSTSTPTPTATPTQTLIPTDAPTTSPTIIITSTPTPPEIITGLGVIGDSNSDECRADDNRAGNSYGGIYAPTTLNWLELLVNKRGVNAGPWGNWGGSRRNGYAYNWALSGVSIGDQLYSGSSNGNIISWGEHTGLANQIRLGLISNVILYIGSNDFNTWNNTYQEVYTYPEYGGLTDSEIAAKTESIITNFTTIIDTLQTASSESGYPINIITTNFPNREAQTNYTQTFQSINCSVSPNCQGSRTRVNDEITLINSQIQTIASSKNVYIIDQYYLATHNSYLSKIIQNPNGLFMQLNNELIDMQINDDEPHHATMSDNHAGTVAGGIAANVFFLPALNSFGAGITPFTDQELVANAGIYPQPTPTATPTSTPTPTSTLTPTPTTIPTATPTTIPGIFNETFDPIALTWTHYATTGQDRAGHPYAPDNWSLVTSTNRYHSANHSYFATDPNALIDSKLETQSFIPSVNQTFRFWHTYNFENRYDGGVIEASINGGTFTEITRTQITQNTYSTTINGTYSPLRGRYAWTGGSLGTMKQVIVNLNAYIGQVVKIRFRVGADNGTGAGGWYIDDVTLQ